VKKIRVLVADDHPGFRDGLCRFLDDENDIEVVARLSNGEEAVKSAKELLPDVSILDVAMPKLNGIEAAKQIIAACPNSHVVIVSAYGYESYLLASLQAGAAGYILKNAPVSELISTVRLVRNGEAVFNLKAVRSVIGHKTVAGEKGIRASLQPREVEVLKLAAKGGSNKRIAQELSIGERTVQTHMANILRKLNVSSRTEAVLRALKEGWLTTDDLP
jgi:DNA-binding NarL/FixJ family response regulator